MSLNFGNFGILLFPQSKRDNEGIGTHQGKERTLSYPGLQFFQSTNYTWVIDAYGNIVSNDVNGFDFHASINLPDNATILSCVIYGSNTAQNWEIVKQTHNTKWTGRTVIGGALIGTTDTTITTPIINNNKYKYWLNVSVTQNDYIYGAKIIYIY